MHVSLQNPAQLTHHLGPMHGAYLSCANKWAAMEAGKIATNITLNDMVCYAVN